MYFPINQELWEVFYLLLSWIRHSFLIAQVSCTNLVLFHVPTLGLQLAQLVPKESDLLAWNWCRQRVIHSITTYHFTTLNTLNCAETTNFVRMCCVDTELSVTWAPGPLRVSTEQPRDLWKSLDRNTLEGQFWVFETWFLFFQLLRVICLTLLKQVCEDNFRQFSVFDFTGGTQNEQRFSLTLGISGDFVLAYFLGFASRN